jgi:hypothetical protein|tara:strand:+ start:1995 stop:2234 length:240 start_codon:yes stop_codon:yes gene_type:complete
MFRLKGEVFVYSFCLRLDYRIEDALKMAIKCANTEFVGKLIKGLIDLHDGTVSMPLQITQKVLQGLIQEQFQKEVLLPL